MQLIKYDVITSGETLDLFPLQRPCDYFPARWLALITLTKLDNPHFFADRRPGTNASINVRVCHRNESKLFYQKLHSWHFSLTFLDKVGHVYFSPKNHVHTILFSKILLLCEVEDQLASKQKKKNQFKAANTPKAPQEHFLVSLRSQVLPHNLVWRIEAGCHHLLMPSTASFGLAPEKGATPKLLQHKCFSDGVSEAVSPFQAHDARIT